MSRTREVVVLAVLALLPAACHKHGHSVREPAGTLIVFCDVSTSLPIPVIRSEADRAFELIKNDTAFRHGEFRIYIADRDIEQNLILKDQKTLERYAANIDRQNERLDGLRDELRGQLAAYAKEHSRNKTCLVKALQSIDSPANRSLGQRQVLIISDLLEDCYAEGDPRNPAALRERISRSLKEFPLPDLHGVRVFLAVISSSIDVPVLRTVWTETLAQTGAQVSVGTTDAILTEIANTRGQLQRR